MDFKEIKSIIGDSVSSLTKFKIEKASVITLHQVIKMLILHYKITIEWAGIFITIASETIVSSLSK